MHLGILGGAGANGLQVLVIPMPLGSPLKATVEQPAHNLLIIGNMPIGVEPEDMGLSGGMLVGNGECRMAHGLFLVGFILWVVWESQSSIRMPTPKLFQRASVKVFL